MPPNNRLAPPVNNALTGYVPMPADPGLVPPVYSRFGPADYAQNLSIGVGEGLTSRLKSAKQAIQDPIQAVREAAASIRQMYDDPMLALQALRQLRQQVMSGPIGMGQAIGEMAPVGVRGAPVKQDIFIGEKAATWNVRAAQNAELLEKAGASPELIWERWGVWRGPDGRWRQEISDEAMTLKKPFESREISKETNYLPPPAEPIEDLLAHPALMEAYPQLKNTQMSLQKQPEWFPESLEKSGEMRSSLGTTPPSFKLSIRSKSPTKALSVAAHELQHGVQDIEKFQPGAMPTDFYAIARQQLETDSFFQALPEKDKLNAISETAFDLYRRTMGEAEARATEARRLMTLEQRRKTVPSKSYDVDFNKLVQRK